MGASRFYIITGGTMIHVAPHFSLCAPAYGQVGESLYFELGNALVRQENKAQLSLEERSIVVLVRTKMALGSSELSVQERDLFRAAGLKFLETNEDLEKLIDYLVTLPSTKGIVLAAAVCDWQPFVVCDAPTEFTEAARFHEDMVTDLRGSPDPSSGSFSGSCEVEFENAFVEQDLGKRMPRLKTSTGNKLVGLRAADKIIQRIRRTRKDIFLVGFKATTGMSEQEQYVTGLGLLKEASCNLVFANDVHEHRNMVITPEEARYHVTKDRKEAIRGLCEMIAMRSQLHFTRSTVVDGDPIPWDSPEIPDCLRTVVNHCIQRGAYKPFRGKTVGHFATRGPKPGIIYTSRRKSNFNELPQDGLLRIDTVGDDQVVAYGAKPSVGGQSQRIIFDEHPDVDCIVHAHIPLRAEEERKGKPGWDQIPVRAQRPYECGSMECGWNTSDGLHEVREVEYAGIKVVMLDEHGPNICFSKGMDPNKVIRFIEDHFDLESKTGGPVSL